MEEGYLAEKGRLLGDLKSSLALKCVHLRSVLRRILGLDEAFTLIILKLLRNIDSKICGSRTNPKSL